jgi:sialate O-acetylesterase
MSDAELALREARESTNGAGLGIAFGIAMADALRRPIGLVPAAHGGSSLEQWSETAKNQSGSSLYGAMLERIRRAGGRLRDVLWYQGESDTDQVADSLSYAERFDRWIAALRSDTGMPNLPVVVVQIGRVLPPSAGPGRVRVPGWDMVREAQATLPGRTPATAVTSAVDLPLTDSIHIGTAGLIRLGRRLARLALHLTDKPSIPAGPSVSGFEPWITPSGDRNGVRVRFEGMTGAWSRTDSIGGFLFHPADSTPAAEPPIVINASVDDEAGDGSVLLLLDRAPAPGEKISYGLGTDPRGDLVDGADMPLCSFMPRPVLPAAGCTTRLG